jgi:ABC-type uncharacterized transport system permease subunit
VELYHHSHIRLHGIVLDYIIKYTDNAILYFHGDSMGKLLTYILEVRVSQSWTGHTNYSDWTTYSIPFNPLFPNNPVNRRHIV